jgi:hypothetical protein
VKTPFSDQWTISSTPAARMRQFRWAVQYPEQRAPPE